MPKPNFSQTTPQGDTHSRSVCNDCGFVDYQNPKVVVGSVVRHKTRDGRDGILLCKRAIEPRSGFWTVPAGYLELHESTEDGAKREAWEEAEATLVLDSLLATYSVTKLSQVQLIYRAHLDNDHYAAGEESLDVQVFAWEDIPWDDLAFPTVHWMLNAERQLQQGKGIVPFTNPIDESPNL